MKISETGLCKALIIELVPWCSAALLGDLYLDRFPQSIFSKWHHFADLPNP